MARSESISTADPLYSPHDQLPAPEPRTESPPKDYFYEHTAKHLIKDSVRIMANGLPIDLEKVSELEDEIVGMIAKVHSQLAENPIVKKFIQIKYKKLIDKATKERKDRLIARIKTPDHFLPKEFKHKNMDHRSYFMHLFARQQGFSEPTETTVTGVPKYTARLVKKLSSQYPVLTRLLEGTLKNHPLIDEAMNLIAEHKCTIYNEKLVPPLEPPSVDIPVLNPGSPDDRHIIFTDILGLESNKLTKGYEKYEKQYEASIRYNKPEPVPPKNKWSWGRKQLELLLPSLTDEDEIALFKWWRRLTGSNQKEKKGKTISFLVMSIK